MRAIAILLAFLLASATALALGQQVASSAPYVVIVHPSNPVTSAERSYLADVFLKKVVRWQHGEAMRPADQVHSAVRARFTEDVLGRTTAAVRSYWQQQIFAGRGLPPPELESDAQVVEFVLRNKGSIGYVSGGAALGAAKVLRVR